MKQLVPVMLIAWFVVTLVLFMRLTPRRALIAQFIAGGLFLPVGGMNIPGLPDITKITVVSTAGLLGAVLFDAQRMMRFRLHWIDGVVLVFCFVPVCSSISNGLGIYDGVSFALDKIMMWGIPYYLGRVYITTPQAYRDLVIGVMIGALAYVPICLWEMKMAPTLHAQMYGYIPFKFSSSNRFGGYRPVRVFTTWD